MKKRFPILALIAGFGILISCKQSSQAVTAQKASDSGKVVRVARPRIGSPSSDPNPFDRYLANTNANWPEPPLLRVATECNVDLDSATRRFAQSPSEKWILVKDLSNALKDQETDFYATVEVWHESDKILVEQWGMELDTGDYFRRLTCLDHKRITLAEVVSWSIELDNDSSKDSGWGYEHRWKLRPDGKFVNIQQGFVDLHEQAMSAPKLDEETAKFLEDESMGAKTWADLELPDALLQ
jgi:hypothetical protein